MYEDVIVHAKTGTGVALCGKKEFAKREVLQEAYPAAPHLRGWDGVTCPECNVLRSLINTPADLEHANQILAASEQGSPASHILPIAK